MSLDYINLAFYGERELCPSPEPEPTDTDSDTQHALDYDYTDILFFTERPICIQTPRRAEFDEAQPVMDAVPIPPITLVVEDEVLPHIQDLQAIEFKENTHQAWKLVTVTRMILSIFSWRSSIDKGKRRAAPESTPEGLTQEVTCGCCFSEFPLAEMAQCPAPDPESHLFCGACVQSHAAERLKIDNCVLPCMDIGGCTLPFARSELARVLPFALLSSYDRLVQKQELLDANIKGLEWCPFCHWACVMDASPKVVMWLNCLNHENGCGIVSCRICKKKKHLGKPCGEIDGADKHLKGRLIVEEAMSDALARRCPKCQKAFVKEGGCNRVICPSCKTPSCYVCRQIVHAYTHFYNADKPSSSTPACPLYDIDNNPEIRHVEEVNAAGLKAFAEYEKKHPGVTLGKDIKVALHEPSLIAV